jgi:predicted nucleic acid-binding protein
MDESEPFGCAQDWSHRSASLGLRTAQQRINGPSPEAITKPHAEAFLHSVSIPPVRLVDPVSYDEVFGLAEQYGLTIYDASYLDLALRERLPLASLDDALVRAAQASAAALFQP